MIRRRRPAVDRQPTAEAVEAFAAGADDIPSLPAAASPAADDTPPVDRHAARNYKAIRVPFNAYEYSRLEALARSTGRTKLNAIRWAILKLAEAEQVPE
jgi:hypothetical protein